MRFLFVFPLVLWACLIYSVQQSHAQCVNQRHLLRRVSSLEQALTAVRAHLRSTIHDVHAVDVKVNRVRGEVTAPQVFTGKLSGTGHYHPGHIIHFNQILANIGGMYDRRTGIVTVRQNGVYSISVRADPQINLQSMLTLDLKLNGRRVISVYGEHGTVGSTSLSLRLTRGNRLWLSQSGGSSSRRVEAATMFSIVRVTPL